MKQSVQVFGPISILVTTTLVVCAADPAMAQASLACANPSALERVMCDVQTALDTRFSKVEEIATQLLLALFTIDIVLSFGRAVKENSPFEDVFAKFTERLVLLSVAFFLMKFMPDILQMLVEQAFEVAQASSGEAITRLKPTDVLRDGVDHTLGLLGNVKVSPSTWLYLGAAIGALVFSAVMILQVLLSYILLYANALIGGVLIGFAGLQATKGISEAYMRAILGKGVFLMALLVTFYLMTGLTNEVAAQADGGASTFAAAATLCVLQVVAIGLIIIVPPQIEQMTGSAAGSAAQTMMAGAAAFALGKFALKSSLKASKAASKGTVKGAAKGASYGLNKALNAAPPQARQMSDAAKARLKNILGK